MAGLSTEMELSKMASSSAFRPPSLITMVGSSKEISHKISILARYSRSRGTLFDFSACRAEHRTIAIRDVTNEFGMEFGATRNKTKHPKFQFYSYLLAIF